MPVIPIPSEVEVFRHRGLTQLELLDQFADRPLTGAQQIQDLPPSPLRQHLERTFHIWNIRRPLLRERGRRLS